MHPPSPGRATKNGMARPSWPNSIRAAAKPARMSAVSGLVGEGVAGGVLKRAMMPPALSIAKEADHCWVLGYGSTLDVA